MLIPYNFPPSTNKQTGVNSGSTSILDDLSRNQLVIIKQLLSRKYLLKAIYSFRQSSISSLQTPFFFFFFFFFLDLNIPGHECATCLLIN